MTATATAMPPGQRIVYPRPPVTVLRSELFVEPAYEGGEPYDQDDEDEE
ncbi:hypothetical protein HZZ00_37760 (plasmid) [Streptomyces sp. NEAU-sy36]|nr:MULTISPECIES: hypothetical protein [unclassified Streptomyces]QLJ06778.1 hypothetical protein HZZ00_37760 [Streptomyces sp. NEAU-sy36]